MTRFAVFDLASLAYPGVVETLDIEAIVTSMRDDLVARFPAIAGVIDLESEPARKLIEVFAYREVLLRARINDAARQRMLAFATGTNLDAIAAYYGVARFDGEDDGTLRRRTQLAPEAMPHGGTIGSYRFLALEAAFPDLKDVGVIARGGGRVDVVLLGKTGQGTVGSDVIEKVRAKLLADDGAPVTDVVTVVGARIVPYAVSVTVHVALGQDPVSVRANALAALEAYVAERHRIGVTVAASGLWRAAHVPNAERVEAIAPLTDIFVKADAAPFCTSITVNVVVRDV
jgi:phage-related baseplate assembly protein